MANIKVDVSCMDYGIAPFALTLSDPQSHSLIASLSNVILRTTVVQ